MTIASTLWRRRAQHRRAALLTTVVACASAAAFGSPAWSLQVALAGGAVLLLGVPHGALDAVVAARAWPGSAARRPRGSFWVEYAALAAAVVLFWALSPHLALLAFLALSAVHFGRGDAAPGGTRLEVLVRGTMPIVLPIVFHGAEVARLFGLLLNERAAAVEPVLRGLAPWTATIWLAAALLYSFKRLSRARLAGVERRTARGDVLELAVLAPAFAVLPPLLSFALYFCVWHSARHLIALDTVLNDRGRRGRLELVRLGAPILAATALLALGAQRFLAPSAADLESWVRVLFVGLAALTAPHVLVTLWVERWSADDERAPPAPAADERPGRVRRSAPGPFVEAS